MTLLCSFLFSFIFFFNDTAPTEIYTLSLHDALPISFTVVFGTNTRAAATRRHRRATLLSGSKSSRIIEGAMKRRFRRYWPPDRKSTRLNSSHPSISYAVFCLKKKKKKKKKQIYLIK